MAARLLQITLPFERSIVLWMAMPILLLTLPLDLPIADSHAYIVFELVL
jgi:hypothetical protein